MGCCPDAPGPTPVVSGAVGGIPNEQAGGDGSREPAEIAGGTRKGDQRGIPGRWSTALTMGSTKPQL